MSDDLDLTLPPRAPEMERYHHVGMRIVPFALYALIDIPSDELTALTQACNAQSRPDNVQVRPAPEYRFVGGPLRRVYDYHLQLGREGQFDPRWFVVVTSKDWREKGILLVTLDDDDLQCKTDAYFIKAEESGIGLVNLQVGNMDWEEVKEGSSLGAPGDDHDNGSDNDQGKDYPPPVFDDGAPRKKHPAGFYIAFYLLQGIDPNQLIRQVQPAPQQPVSEYICRFEGHLTRESDLVDQAATLHPQRCRDNPFLHRQMFFVVDSEQYVQEGLSMVKLEWNDEGLKDCEMEELARRGREARREAKRVACVVHKLVPDFCAIARGDQKWSD
ncbi:hypothetical protein DTO271G3_2524 [Paecilomyces variotii]|nr:hypothetical protein DTO271G3_2524 [Paecilomyces variotii]